jgi:hypothetical protein
MRADLERAGPAAMLDDFLPPEMRVPSHDRPEVIRISTLTAPSCPESVSDQPDGHAPLALPHLS